MAMHAIAGIKIVDGSVDDVIIAKKIAVAVNWDNAVYGKSGTLDDFLAKAERNDDWAEESMSYMLRKLNAQTGEYGVRFVGTARDAAAEYSVEIVVSHISKGGDLRGDILFRKKGERQPLAVMAFTTDDADDDDRITFRDQFKSIGDSLGKFFAKKLKAAYK